MPDGAWATKAVHNARQKIRAFSQHIMAMYKKRLRLETAHRNARVGRLSPFGCLLRKMLNPLASKNLDMGANY